MSSVRDHLLDLLRDDLRPQDRDAIYQSALLRDLQGLKDKGDAQRKAKRAEADRAASVAVLKAVFPETPETILHEFSAAVGARVEISTHGLLGRRAGHLQCEPDIDGIGQCRLASLVVNVESEDGRTLWHGRMHVRQRLQVHPFCVHLDKDIRHDKDVWVDGRAMVPFANWTREQVAPALRAALKVMAKTLPMSGSQTTAWWVVLDREDSKPKTM